MKVFYFHSFSSSHLLAYFLLLRSQKENLTVLLCFYFFDVIVFLHFPFSDTYNYFKDAGCKKISFCSIRFSFMDTDDSQYSRGREGTMFYSTLPLPPAHKHSDIYLQLCMWDDYHLFLITLLVFTRLPLNEIYHLIKLPFD